ncbi:hypothetical protein HYV49_01470 [Candidatus Pacearchaeota archaeon]|nr:hypothetical protein [Candidatus Pacearchaeota archaeon]
MKAQVSIEFLIITGVVIFFFVGFLVILNINFEEANRQKENTLMKDFALEIRKEIGIAAHSSDGYYREFFIPETISGKDYEINITENILQIKTRRNALTLAVEEVNGTIIKGKNIIRKAGGNAQLN